VKRHNSIVGKLEKRGVAGVENLTTMFMEEPSISSDANDMVNDVDTDNRALLRRIGFRLDTKKSYADAQRYFDETQTVELTDKDIKQEREETYAYLAQYEEELITNFNILGLYLKDLKLEEAVEKDAAKEDEESPVALERRPSSICAPPMSDFESPGDVLKWWRGLDKSTRGDASYWLTQWREKRPLSQRQRWWQKQDLVMLLILKRDNNKLRRNAIQLRADFNKAIKQSNWYAKMIKKRRKEKKDKAKRKKFLDNCSGRMSFRHGSSRRVSRNTE